MALAQRHAWHPRGAWHFLGGALRED